MIFHIWESIFPLPSHLRDKLVECEIIGLIFFLKCEDADPLPDAF